VVGRAGGIGNGMKRAIRQSDEEHTDQHLVIVFFVFFSPPGMRNIYLVTLNVLFYHPMSYRNASFSFPDGRS